MRNVGLYECEFGESGKQHRQELFWPTDGPVGEWNYARGRRPAFVACAWIRADRGVCFLDLESSANLNFAGEQVAGRFWFPAVG